MNIGDGYKGLDILANSLSTAVDMRFMAAEHASAIWKEQLKLAGVDVAKKTTVLPVDAKTAVEKTEEVKA